MYVKLNNDNYGYAVATRGEWLAVGNPSFNTWPPTELGISTSGSVDVFLYNKQSDLHVLKDTFFRHILSDEELLLASETDINLHTEYSSSVPITSDKDLLIDFVNYMSGSINDYGRSLDIHNRLLGVGYTRNRTIFKFDTITSEYSSSGGVDIYDLGCYVPDQISFKKPISLTSSSSLGGYFSFFVDVPPGYNGVTLLNCTSSATDLNLWNVIDYQSTDYAVGGIYIFTLPNSIVSGFFTAVEYVDSDPYILTIRNPYPTVTESFGWSVSINDDWIAVGSPHYSQSRGAVHMYKRAGGSGTSNLSWSLHSTITASDSRAGDLFGWSLELNDASGFVGYSTKSIAYSQSLVVGTHKASGSRVYYFEISGSEQIVNFTVSASYTSSVTRSIDTANWNQFCTLSPIYTNYPLTYYPELYPILSSSWTGPSPVSDLFGFDVSIYGDTIAIGAPFDRYYYEYTQSAVYQQGAFYIFERCPIPENGFVLKMKSHGTEDALKNHRMGYSLDTYAGKLVVGCPKITAIQMASSSMTPCYIQGSLTQAHFCRTEDEYKIQGQYCYLQYNTTSLVWEYNNTYQIKKRYLSPYRNFGFSADMDDRFIAVGSPMNLSGSDRVIDIYYSGSNTEDFAPITGQAYIYNLDNYRDQFHIGNVFYRNGKIVVITSGSQFDGLFFNEIADKDYQYDLFFHNKQTVHEKQVICEVSPGEFNVSTNPSAIVLTSSIFDLNRNGRVDFQDIDVLLMYMNHKKTEDSSAPTTDWSSSLLVSDDEISWHNFLKYSGKFYGTEKLYSSSFALLNSNAMYQEMDLNQDSIIDANDQNILWKYFANRLDNKNFNKYITVNSGRRLYGSVIDHLNWITNHTPIPSIKSDFFDYDRLSKEDTTGSYLTPYVTSIGLYQGGDLCAVAKLGSPIKLLPDYPYNFVVKMDF